MSKKLNSYEIWQPFLLASMVAIGMIIGNKMNEKRPALIESISNQEALGAIGRVEEIVRFIETRYVDSLDSDLIVENAISDIIDDLDPHSIYLKPSQLIKVNEQMDGNYRGIGVESFFLNDTVRISKVLKKTPAQKAGIRPFDQLIAVDDSIVAGKNLDYSIIREMLRAIDKEEITLTIKRKGEKNLIKLEIEPEAVELHSSNISYEISEGIGFIKIQRFSSNTYKEFMQSLEVLIDKDSIRNLIIDVRDNPGGYLPETVNILSQLFDEKGKLLVYTAGKDGRKTEYKSSGKNFFSLDKIVVLIDEGSASGSEILAGAIQDWDRGLVVGRRSFGKGLVQEQYRLRNGGAIRLTTARYYTASGRSIQKPYENGEDYENDIYNRYSNGELFSKEKFQLQDSTIYLTKILSRKVYGGGGVFPDVFIPVDSSYSQIELNQIKAYIPEYIYLNRSNGDTVMEDKLLQLKNFLNYLDKKGIRASKIMERLNNDALFLLLKSEESYQNFSDLEREKVLNANDAFIEAAFSYIKSDKNLKDY